MIPLTRRRKHAALLVVGVALLGACSKKEPAPTVSPDAPDPAKADMPLGSFVKLPDTKTSKKVFVSPVPFGQKHKRRTRFHAIDGALMISTESHVGRVVGEDVDWLNGGLDAEPRYDRMVQRVYGRWPDTVGMVVANVMARTTHMNLLALTTKGEEQPATISAGNSVVGTAVVGDTVLAATHDYNGYVKDPSGRRTYHGARYALVTTHGPPLKRSFTPAANTNCKPKTANDADADADKPIHTLDSMLLGSDKGRAMKLAVPPIRFAGTPAGTLISVGLHCSGSGAAAEVWDKDGKASIVDLSRWLTASNGLRLVRLLPGKGDVMWIDDGSGGALLQYRNGKFNPLPILNKPVVNSFVSDQHELHVSDGDTIYRRAHDFWQPLAQLAWPTKFQHMALYRGHLWVQRDMRVGRLQAGNSFAYRDGCTTPFVWLRNMPEYTKADESFDKVRSALAHMPDAGSLQLTFATIGGGQRLGIRVRDEAQGRAVLEFARANLTAKQPAAEPRLMCAATPADARALHFLDE